MLHLYNVCSYVCIKAIAILLNKEVKFLEGKIYHDTNAWHSGVKNAESRLSFATSYSMFVLEQMQPIAVLIKSNSTGT